ncbi:Translation initiation factor 2 subunit beta [Candidatus Tiddalikarchaeum anstoanum]|nr:Translation initiation factor 2 subunit beta [Candidatus Tiddalikarchaeum anstoanum]
MKTYEELLKRAEVLMPKKIETRDRFEVPKVKGSIQGKRTMISNLKNIADYLYRDVDLLIPFLEKELATKAIKDGNYIVFMGKFSAGRINDKILEFVNEYVKCRQCGKPDTKTSKKDRVLFVECMGCGAKYPIRK